MDASDGDATTAGLLAGQSMDASDGDATTAGLLRDG
jgi:hypothetical protein